MTTFALPTIDSNAMTTNDQGALLVNQATAIIVQAYLTHGSQWAQLAVDQSRGWQEAALYLIEPGELPALIDSVQTALRQF